MEQSIFRACSVKPASYNYHNMPIICKECLTAVESVTTCVQCIVCAKPFHQQCITQDSVSEIDTGTWVCTVEGQLMSHTVHVVDTERHIFHFFVE